MTSNFIKTLPYNFKLQIAFFPKIRYYPFVPKDSIEAMY